MLRGQKVILRAVERADLPRQVAFANDPEFMVLISDDPVEPVSLARREAQFEEKLRAGETEGARFAIEADGKYIGHCLLYDFDPLAHTCLLGIGIGDPAYRGGGYGRDAVAVLLRYAFELRNVQKVALTAL